MSEIALGVTGMTCTACARHVEQALKGVAGVHTVHVDYSKGVARIDSDSVLALDLLNAALPQQYRVGPLPVQGAHGEAVPHGSLPGRALGTFGGLRKRGSGAEQPLNIAVIGTGGAPMRRWPQRSPRPNEVQRLRSSNAAQLAALASTSAAYRRRS